MQQQVVEPDDQGQLHETQLQQEDLIAAIDIGSNSLRLVVAQIIPGPDYRVLDEERVEFGGVWIAHVLRVYGRRSGRACHAQDLTSSE